MNEGKTITFNKAETLLEEVHKHMDVNQLKLADDKANFIVESMENLKSQVAYCTKDFNKACKIVHEAKRLKTWIAWNDQGPVSTLQNRVDNIVNQG